MVLIKGWGLLWGRLGALWPKPQQMCCFCSSLPIGSCSAFRAAWTFQRHNAWVKAHPTNKVNGEDFVPCDSRGKRNPVWNKINYFCCSAVINSGKPHWSVQELWLDQEAHSHTHIPKSHIPNKKNALTQTFILLKSTKDHTFLCLFVSMPWKKHYACQYETFVSLWYYFIEEGPCDQWFNP